MVLEREDMRRELLAWAKYRERCDRGGEPVRQKLDYLLDQMVLLCEELGDTFDGPAVDLALSGRVDDFVDLELERPLPDTPEQVRAMLWKDFYDLSQKPPREF